MEKDIHEITDSEISEIEIIVFGGSGAWESKSEFLETLITEQDDMRVSFKSCMAIRKWLVENSYKVPE